MELEFEVIEIDREGYGGAVAIQLQAKHDYTIYNSNLFLKVRPEDAALISLRQKFRLTPLDPSASDLDAAAAEQEVAEKTR